MREFKVAFRSLLRQPSFAAAAIGTLALGIAAPTALFAVVNATLLRPLPYPHFQDIYTVRTTMTDGRFTIGLVASEELSALRRATGNIAASAMVYRRDDTIVTPANSRQVTAVGVSEEFFDLFGMPMAAGSTFSSDDYKAPYGSRVILSSRVWRASFGGDPTIVGRTIQFAPGAALVIGIAPDTFDVPHGNDVWFAQHNAESVGHTFDAYVRFAPGLTPASIQGPMPQMWNGLAQKYPDQERNRIFVMRPLLETMVGDLRPIILIAFGATGLLLLLAIVNVANLLLARGTTRTREIAVRTALGATRADLLRHLLAESILMALGATAVGIPLALGAVRAITAIGGTKFPRVDGMRLDPRVFLFAAVAMVIVAIVVAVGPALTMAKANLTELVNEGGRGGLQGRGTRRVLNAMVVVEVTLAIALVAGAGRLLLSVEHLLAIDPGFTSEGRLAIDVLLPAKIYFRDPARTAAWAQQADERLRALGATSVGMASTLPLRREWDSTAFVDISGRPIDPSHRPNGRIRLVTPGFFDVLKIRVVQGRLLTEDDRRDGAPVVLVNQAWARTFLPGLDPLRERVNPGMFGTLVDGKYATADAAIVGVVGDVPYSDLTTAAEPIVYVSMAQVPAMRRTLVIATADGHPERLVPQIRAELAKLDPQVPTDFEAMPHVVSTSLTWPKLGLLLMGTFGAAALVLAATGVFGVIAFVASQRSGEMAVRLALGASPGHVFRLIALHGGRLAVLGLVIGLFVAWWTGQLMGRYVYHVSAASPAVLGGSAILVFIVSIGATLPSAWRSATIRPALASANR